MTTWEAMTPAERREWTRGNAGVRSVRVSPQTGTVVAVYDARAAGMDAAGGRWSTVCEDHATICSHATLALAEYHAADPAGWCESCRPDECQHAVASDCPNYS